jgi:hypothetical protein
MFETLQFNFIAVICGGIFPRGEEINCGKSGIEVKGGRNEMKVKFGFQWWG